MFHNLLAAVGLAILATTATTSAHPAESVAARDSDASGFGPYGFYACTAASWLGRCAHVRVDNHKCANLEPWLDRAMVSFGPDSGYECTAYTARDCRREATTLSVTMGWPGSDGLGELGGKARSVGCRIKYCDDDVE
ncbi:hypothetical protein K490DRAFT_62917 [Saccharata proteae CBS 121410]|uniref:Uncharacterized protein n=1 Tax=Saccharata proteae CBS 121410 TaxID=1314787 RepID=A0A9P4HYA4_9PEZI|nr:hypothetical protein K490DRAFT_62917 [Saccharata proteae CBS 121410]